MITNELQNLSYIFNFSKIFYESYHKKLPLINFPRTLEKLINTDIIQLTKSSELHILDKANIWMEEAYLNFERISKIGVEANKKLILELVPNKIQDSSFIQALTAFNERNYNIANCLVNKKSLIDNENLIKSQIKLEAFRNLSLELYIDKSKSELQNLTDHLNENFELKPSIIIQEKYLERFINSLDNFTLGNSKNNLLKIFRGENITEGIKFSCPANSVIKFFKDRHTEQIIVSSKADIAKFISTYFMFKKKQTQEFAYPKLENIKNYLTRSLPPSGTSTIIPFVES
ncbi:hypothetical protein [Chryseobacterium bernardetii]|uniref:hypothetical protein n=1 Tax=Chryseobacterium bernardetii TaxID=1241978 RepID=UPI00301B048A